jgi:MFS family permease
VPDANKIENDDRVVRLPAASAAAEWGAYWYLPLVAALGYSTAGMHVYGLGPLMESLHSEFGWTHAQTLSGSAIVSVVVALASMPMGMLIDRFGPRRVSLPGLLLIGAAVALLGTATGTTVNWLSLWVLVGLSSMPIQATAWTTAVVSRFDASRGLALAITLSGSSIGAFAFPLLTTWLLQRFGWREAFFGLGGIWVLVVLPLVFLFFRGAQDHGTEARLPARPASNPASGLTMREAMRKPAFYRLLFATLFFTFAIFGSVVNFVPILRGTGATLTTAARAASLIGIFSLLGRLSTGAVLDRFPAHIVGAVCFLIPIPGCALLLSDVPSAGSWFAAAALIGLTLGAEVDVIAYLATRYFGLRNFGSIQGALLCATAVGAAFGPLGAGATFDHFGSYRIFLETTIVLMFISALIIVTGKNRPRVVRSGS